MGRVGPTVRTRGAPCRRRQHQGVRRQPAAAARARPRRGRAPRGHLPGVAVRVPGPGGVLRRGRAGLPGARQHGGGPDRALAERAVPVPRAAPRAVRRGPGRPAARAGRAPELQRHGCRPTSGGDLPALSHLRRVPLLRRGQERCRDLRGRPGAGDRARPAGDRRTGPADRHRPHRAAGRPPGRRGAGRAGRGARRTLRAVRRRGELGCAAAGLGRRPAPAWAGELLGPGGSTVHDAQQRPPGRCGRRPAQRRHVPEDALGQRLVRRRRRRLAARVAAAHRQGAGRDDEELGHEGAAGRAGPGRGAAASSGW